MMSETPRDKDFTIAKLLVREWLIEKGIALTGVHGEASSSTVNRFKLDLQRRIVDLLNAERERCAKIAETKAGERCMGHQNSGAGVCGYDIAAAIRGSKQ